MCTLGSWGSTDDIGGRGPAADRLSCGWWVLYLILPRGANGGSAEGMRAHKGSGCVGSAEGVRARRGSGCVCFEGACPWTCDPGPGSCSGALFILCGLAPAGVCSLIPVPVVVFNGISFFSGHCRRLAAACWRAPVLGVAVLSLGLPPFLLDYTTSGPLLSTQNRTFVRGDCTWPEPLHHGDNLLSVEV